MLAMKRHTLFSVSILMITFLSIVSGMVSGTEASSTSMSTCESVSRADTSAAAAAMRSTLCGLIEKGRLDDLEWPDFQNYREQVEQFYSVDNYALGWVSGNRPTS
jgi:hypothetical protein